MNRRRLLLIAGTWSALALPVASRAQQPFPRMPRIAYLSGRAGPPDPSADAVRDGLRQLGYVEGKNIHVEYRYFRDKLHDIPGVVAELRQLKVDVLVTPTPSVMAAARQVTQTIPMVMVWASDPVATGTVHSLARPGGNITGVTRLRVELSAKRLELLKEFIRASAPVGVIWGADEPAAVSAYKEYVTAGRALKVNLLPLEVRAPKPDFEGAYQAAVNARAGAVIAISTTLILSHAKPFADIALKHRLPFMAEAAELAEAGALVSYGADNDASFRRVAVYIDKILKGAKPGDLPIEQARHFQLLINLKTAKALGITIPQSVLLQATRVIE
jgi:putative tryptophan/tyrosine transport system substrate-binding protein